MEHHGHRGEADQAASKRQEHHSGGSERDKHAGHSVALFRRKFWVTFSLTLPTLIWGHMLQGALGYQAPRITGSHWVPAIFGTAVFLYGGTTFIRGAVAELRNRSPGMMTLITLAISVAFVFSAAVSAGVSGMPLWEELATLITIMLLGHWIEMRSISRARGALAELAKLLPPTAIRFRGEETEEIAVDQLKQYDVVLVKPGARVPADGIVRAGNSDVNESMITGESKPVTKTISNAVIAGTVNGSGSLRVEVTGTGERTALARIMQLVEQAQGSRSHAQNLADRAAFALTIIALGAAGITFVTWMVLGAETSFAIERVVTTLVISCPHALGLAIPLVIAISTTQAARNGLLVRDRRGLEKARNITTVVFDKTGTLTRGEFGVVDITAVEIDENEALRLVAAAERNSEHTIAQGILRCAKERGISAGLPEDFEALAGLGVRARIGERDVFVGGPAMLRKLELTLPSALQAAADIAAANGHASVILMTRERPLAIFALADVVRPEAAEAVQRLHERSVGVVMMTGDATPVAKAVARELSIETVLAEVLPAQKSEHIRAIQKQGKRVAMVGDGVNDAPALLTADVGIAIGAGTDVAVEAGDIVLVRSDPRDIPRIIDLSRATYRKMIQNLAWAAGYNIVAIPLAAGVLANRGILLSPAAGAILMSVSTIVVAINAQLLRRIRL